MLFEKINLFYSTDTLEVFETKDKVQCKKQTNTLQTSLSNYPIKDKTGVDNIRTNALRLQK